MADVKDQSHGGGIHAATERVHVKNDNRPAIDANCTAAWNGQNEALKDAKEHLYEIGCVLVDGAPHSIFHVTDSGSDKPYRLLPLSSLIELPAPAVVKTKPAAEESYFVEPKDGEPQKLPQYFAYWRAPVFFAAAAGRKEVVTTILSRHADAAADRARIYSVKSAGSGQWSVQENAHELATTPKPKFVTAADVARANGFSDVAVQLEKSYRMCGTEDCVIA